MGSYDLLKNVATITENRTMGSVRNFLVHLQTVRFSQILSIAEIILMTRLGSKMSDNSLFKSLPLKGRK